MMIRFLMISTIIGISVLFAQTLRSQSIDSEVIYSEQYDLNSLAFSSQPSTGLRIFLPSVGVSHSHSLSNLSDVIYKVENNYKLDATALTQNTKDFNRVSGAFDVQSIGVSYGLANMEFWIGHSVEYDASTTFTDVMAELYANGNQQYIGETVALMPDISLTGFHRYKIGYKYLVQDFNISVQGSYLSGFNSLDFEKNAVLLTTDNDNYGLNFDNDILIHATNTLDYNGIDDVEINLGNNFGDTFFSGNSGFDLQIAAGFSVDDILSFRAGIKGLGFINWKEDNRTYSANNQTSFTGIDLSEYIRSDDEFVLEDSLKSLLDITETTETYKTSLPTAMQFSVTYSPYNNIDIVTSLQHIQMRRHNMSLVSVSANYMPIDAVHLGLSYTYTKDSPLNIGVLMRGQLGPAELFFTARNVLSLINPLNSSLSSTRLGLNLRFDKLVRNQGSSTDIRTIRPVPLKK